MRTPAVTLFATLALAAAGPAEAGGDYAYGPRPDWTRYRELGEAAVRARLPDPAGWAVEWPNGYAPFVWFHKGRHPGYATCGVLRRSDGAVVQRPIVNFAVVIDYDAVKKVQVAGRYSNDIVNLACAEMVSRGTLPPARFMEAPAAASQEATVAALGVTVRTMPEGAYVVAVEPGSPGQHAGLTPGTVITHVNGIALAGLAAAMKGVLGSDAPLLEVATAAGDKVVVQRRTP